MKKITKNVCVHLIIFLSFMAFFPMTTFGASGTCANTSGSIQIGNSSTGIKEVLNWATCLIEGSVVPLLFAIAMVVFLYGIVLFILETQPEEKAKGRMFMIWGIVALAVMFSIWGLVGILENTFGVSNLIPQLPTHA